MNEPRRLHPAAIAVYSAQALGNFALPLLLIVGMSVLGGGLDTGDLARTAMYGAIGLVISGVAGYTRWRTTRYWITETAIHHHTGFLREKDTQVPLERVEAIDVHQGLLQRWFGVLAVEVQTGAGGKGGEISLPALTPAAVEELRNARPGASAPAAAETPVGRRLSGRELAVAALTAGQFGIVLPVLAAAGQAAQQVFEEDRGRDAVRLIPHSETAAVGIVVGVVALAWVLSILGAVVAFAGFEVTRDEDRLRIRRGLIQRRAATVPVGRVRAVRVVEGLVRRPFGLASLHVEVIGYAEEASAARTLFPLVRVREVEAFLRELLPELADDPLVLERPPARAARRYLLLPVLVGLVVTVGLWFLLGPFSLVALLFGVAYGWARWRAAGWHLRDGRLVVRSMGIARTTVLAPARFGESHTLAQNWFQRRASLADLEVSLGKKTRARIRQLDAGVARRAWAAL